MELTVPFAIGSVALVLLGLGALFDDRRNRLRRWADLEGEDFEQVLPLLHSINDDRCIGCEACIDTCPTEVLDLVDHKVRVSRFSDCVQCEQCANACPTQALVMYREGTTPRMLTVPELDDHFQTGVPGQYLIGEVAGKPLVKNAANLGRAVIEHIARDLAARPPTPANDVLDVVIVGSGPAGLSSGLTCLARKLSFAVLEKEHLISSTVSRYPKGKHFMAEPCSAQNLSYLPVFDASKEELVDAWKKVVEAVKMPVKLGEAVEKVTRGEDGIFVTKTTVGLYRSRTVVLATGLRGKPRLLTVPGANLEKVMALLDDPAEFAGEHVLVVGGGDSAVEGAMSLVDAGATVTLSYRGDGFKRCKQGNQKRLAELSAANKLSVLLESNVSEFTEDKVSIKLKDGSITTIPNQRAFVLIGADTPVTWLEANNVRFVERPHLYALGSSEDAVRRIVPEAIECPKDPEHAISALLGHPQHKSATARARSVVDHLRDEFREVVTNVSGVFRMPDPHEKPRRTSQVHSVQVPRAAPRAASGGVQYGTRIIPAERLVGRASGALPAVRPERAASAFGHETSTSGPRYVRPRSLHLGDTSSHPHLRDAPIQSTGQRQALTHVLNQAESLVPRSRPDDRATVPLTAMRPPRRASAAVLPPPPPRAKVGSNPPPMGPQLARGSADLSGVQASRAPRPAGAPPALVRRDAAPPPPPPPPRKSAPTRPPPVGNLAASHVAIQEIPEFDEQPTVISTSRFG